MAIGKFITVEGTEGVGKSTNIDFIRSYLANKNIDLIVTREPGGTPLAEDIRTLLLEKREELVGDTTELLLVFAARAQHMQQVILPALNRGQWVLCDRFTDATYAYQGAGRGVSLEKIALLEDLVQGTLRPDITLLLDIDVETGLLRASQRGDLDRFESEQVEFFEKVRQMYLQLAHKHATRYRIIDASQTLANVQAAIAHELENLN